MVRKSLIAVASAAALIAGGGFMTIGGSAQEEMSPHSSRASNRGSRCSEATIRGTYGMQMQGTTALPPAQGGGLQTVVGVLLRTYDGAGAFTQVDNIHGSVTGIEPDRPGAGTYQVNDDCSGVTLFQPAPGVTIEERMVIVDHGAEIRTIASSPLSTMVSTVGKRIDNR